ncbi:peptidyl-prolyl cis-trans isomerase-like 6, partial [Silurus asotus]
LEIVGLLKTTHFHAAKGVAERLTKKFPASFGDPVILHLLESDWHVYTTGKGKELRGQMWQYLGNVVCFVNGTLLGDEKQLCSWAKKHWNLTFYCPQALYAALAQESQRTTALSGSLKTERLCFSRSQLFSDLCPKTCENFKALCTGEAGNSQSQVMLCYKNTLFSRVVPNVWVQGGEIAIKSKGNREESIYCPTFAYENFSVSHNKRGILGMANQGPHTNSSQFYITLQPALWMDRKYVAFGQVVEGTDVLRRLEEVPTYNERPKEDCKIVTCGLFNP